MSVSRWRVAAAAIATACASCSDGTLPEPGWPRFVVTGEVTDWEQRAAVGGVEVSISVLSPAGSQVVLGDGRGTTDEHGNYSATVVMRGPCPAPGDPPGVFRLRVNRADYLVEQWDLEPGTLRCTPEPQMLDMQFRRSSPGQPRLVADVVAPTALAAGATLQGSVSCAVVASGQTYCWGNGGAPAVIAGNIQFTTIAVGLTHSCALDRAGAAYCWGANGAAQLGTGDQAERAQPAPVVGGLAFASIAVGSSHSCALTSQGRAYCWGSNLWGALGVPGIAQESSAPVAVTGGHTFRSIAAGSNSTCALDDAGRVWCWGSDEFGVLGNGPDLFGTAVPGRIAGGRTYTALAVGTEHACALTAAGEAECWGLNSAGQLGIGTHGSRPPDFREEPQRVAGTLLFAAIAAGAGHSCATDREGAAFCWGHGGEGVLGTRAGPECSYTFNHKLYHIPCATRPLAVEGGLSFRALALGRTVTCGITVDGKLYCWGRGEDLGITTAAAARRDARPQTGP